MSSTTEPRMDKNAIPKRYYFRLESESSRASEEDTESVYSIQGVETELVKDTTDTDTKSETEYEVEFTYEDSNLSGEDSSLSTSCSEGMALAAAAAVAIYDSSLENFITDGEDSDTSSLDGTFILRKEFWTCIQCKSRNNNPNFRYCQKCFQARKTFFPPRPRGHRKPKEHKQNYIKAPVKLDTLRNCLCGLSQDSGIGSSQECPSLDLDKIVVPKHLSPSTSGGGLSIINEEKLTITDDKIKVLKNYPEISVVRYVSIKENEKNLTTNKRKRHISESSSISECEENVKKMRRNEIKKITKTNNLKVTEGNSVRILEESVNEKNFVEATKSSVYQECKVNVIEDNSINKILEESVREKKSNINFVEEAKSSVPQECKELCMFCNTIPKDSVFLHGKIGHMCCCYKCAMRTWKTIKRCPICNRKVNNVVKIYTT